MKDLPLLNDTVIEYNDEFQRARLRALQSVDEMIENLVKILEEKGELENTYVIFTTDNGYHISQHRMYLLLKIRAEEVQRADISRYSCRPSSRQDVWV